MKDLKGNKWDNLFEPKLYTNMIRIFPSTSDESAGQTTLRCPLAWVNCQGCLCQWSGEETEKDSVWACERGKMPKGMIFRKNLSHKVESSVPWSSGDRGGPNTYALRTPAASVLAPWGMSLGIRRKNFTVPMEGMGRSAVSDRSINVWHTGDWSRKWKTWQGPRICGTLWVHVKCWLGWNFWCDFGGPWRS